MKRLIESALFLLLSIAAFAAESLPVTAESLTRLDTQAAKTVSKGSTVYGQSELTVYYDNAGDPLLLVETIDYPAVGKTAVDTFLVKPDLKVIFHSGYEIVNGESTAASTSDFSGKWKPANDRWPSVLTAIERDKNGNWTAGEEGKNTLSRTIYYTPVASDGALTAYYEAKRANLTKSILPEPVRRFWPLAIALLLIAAGAFMAVETLKWEPYIPLKKRKLNTTVTTAFFYAGLLFLAVLDVPWPRIHWVIGISALAIFGMFIFMREVSERLAKDRSLSNNEFNKFFVPPIFVMGLTGLIIGMILWHNLPLAILLIFPYMLPGLASRTTDLQRCPSCRNKNTLQPVGRINTGIHTHVQSTESKKVGPWKDIEVFKSAEGYNSRSRATERHTIHEMTIRYQKYRIKYRCSVCGHESLSVEFRERISSEQDTTHYDKTIERHINVN